MAPFQQLCIVYLFFDSKRYLALSHPRGTPPKSMAFHDRLLGVGRMRMLADGLSDLEYTVLRTDKNRLFTNVTVDV